MKTLIFAALLLILTACATEPQPPPDFYDRSGVACWRLTDFIWCEDGYESETTTDTRGLRQRAHFTAQRYHSHTWIKQSETTDDNGKKVCIWSCIGDSSHVAVTSGYGYCAYPN